MCDQMNITTYEDNKIACAEAISGGYSYPTKENSIMCPGGVIRCFLFATIGITDSINGNCFTNRTFSEEGDQNPEGNWMWAGQNNQTFLDYALEKENYTWTISHTTTNGINNGFPASVIGRTYMKVLALCSTPAYISSFILSYKIMLLFVIGLLFI